MKEQNRLEQLYVNKYNKKLRLGYTTGSCAAGAAKAAAIMLLKKNTIQTVELMTPKGILLHLKIEDSKRQEEWVSCAIRKDGGDDPDETNGILVYAKVSKLLESSIQIKGGIGVGRITKKGLEQPIGEAAINKVPRKMIIESIQEVCKACNYKGGILVEISVPAGVEIAKKTFNPRLGIVGGISILGTSGIVVPMSEDALIESIRIEMKMLAENGAKYLIITPGNYGEEFLKKNMSMDLSYSMKCSNYIGETIDMAIELGIKGILFISHIGKFIKVSGGIMNTHSRCADSRAELMASHALRAGISLEGAKKILDTITTEEALEILIEENVLENTIEEVLHRIQYYLEHRSYKKLEFGVILFSNVYGMLGETKSVASLISKLKKQDLEKHQ